MQLWRYIYSRLCSRVCVYVCVHWLSWCICKYIVAQNLTFHGNINWQGYRNVRNIVCFYLMAHCILGVVVCLKGRRCRCSWPAPVGLVFLTVLSLIYLCGRLLPRQNWSSWTSELLTHPTHIYAQMHKCARMRTHTYTHFSSLIFALPCNKKKKIVSCAICISISLAKIKWTSALHCIHNVQ